jgi:hypothetical protein
MACKIVFHEKKKILLGTFISEGPIFVSVQYKFLHYIDPEVCLSCAENLAPGLWLVLD